MIAQTEISYATYCRFGASRNPQLYRKDLYSAMNGRFLKTRYYAKENSGVLIYPSNGE